MTIEATQHFHRVQSAVTDPGLQWTIPEIALSDYVVFPLGLIDLEVYIHTVLLNLC